jgi:hypothetical protein
MQFDVDLFSPIHSQPQVLKNDLYQPESKRDFYQREQKNDFYQRESKNDFHTFAQKNERTSPKSDTLIGSLRSIAIDYMDCNFKMTGEISQRKLTDICMSNGVNINNPDYKDLCEQMILIILG